MKPFLLSLSLVFVSSSLALGQENILGQDFLFDEEDIVIRAQESDENENDYNDEQEENLDNSASKTELNNAVTQAKDLLNKKPVKLPKIKIPHIKRTKTSPSIKPINTQNLNEAPFGLYWGVNQSTTLSQGINLQKVELKDYVNSFLATSLPKPLDFFERIYAVFGKDDKLYRILSYSKFIDDDSSAKKTLEQYNKYSNLLEKKYGNKQTFFTPATIEKTIINAQKKEEIVKETAPIGNPDFLNQLAGGSAFLYSTYNNTDVAAALSIGVDGEKKSYIVIDYKNLKILQEQENETLDAL